VVELTFNEAINASGALNSSVYQVKQSAKKGHKTVNTPVGFSVSYAAPTVTLTLSGKPTFTAGGLVTVNASGITDASGQPLTGTTTFSVRPHASGISG
jgi:hypothetical protein